MNALKRLSSIDSECELINYVYINPEIDDIRNNVNKLSTEYDFLEIEKSFQEERSKKNKLHDIMIEFLGDALFERQIALDANAESLAISLEYPYLNPQLFELSEAKRVTIKTNKDISIKLPKFTVYAHNIDYTKSKHGHYFDDIGLDWNSQPAPYNLTVYKDTENKIAAAQFTNESKDDMPSIIKDRLLKNIKEVTPTDNEYYQFRPLRNHKITIDEYVKEKIMDARKYFKNNIYYIAQSDGKNNFTGGDFIIGLHAFDLFFISYTNKI